MKIIKDFTNAFSRNLGCLGLVVLCSVSNSEPLGDQGGVSHGGGLNACGCHFNRKTGECHCHQPRECGCQCQPAWCPRKHSEGKGILEQANQSFIKNAGRGVDFIADRNDSEASPPLVQTPNPPNRPN